MVRHNILCPKVLTDQHLAAENTEIDMAVGYYRRYPKLDGTEPKFYTLGKGHIKFFKDKLLYLYKRQLKIRKEMIRRGFNTTLILNWSLDEFPKELHNDWKPYENDYIIIRERIIERLSKKPEWYRYYRKHYNLDYYVNLLFKCEA